MFIVRHYRPPIARAYLSCNVPASGPADPYPARSPRVILNSRRGPSDAGTRRNDFINPGLLSRGKFYGARHIEFHGGRDDHARDDVQIVALSLAGLRDIFR